MTAARLLAATVAATVVVIVGLPKAAVAVTPPSTASKWLERMNLAVRTLNYEGRFVYQHGAHLEAFYLRHVVNDRGEHERLRTLNGPPREVVRDSDQVTCSLAKRGTVNLDRRASNPAFSPLLPIRTKALADHYEFALGASSRVAGRQAQEVRIRPRDTLRYGYSLALDLQHALPLQITIRDAEGLLISRIMFIELTVGIEAQAPNDHLDESALIVRPRVIPIEDRGHWLQPPLWRFDQTPVGFELNVHRRHRLEDTSAVVDHFIFSDGLATVSVYVEPERANALDGMVQLGPVNAYGFRLNGHSITAVGEVPARTVRSFGQAIVANSSDGQ